MRGRGRRLAALGALCLAPLLAGCWDATDINDRTPTVAVGFDTAPHGGYEVTLGNALGTSSSGQSPAGIAVGITPTATGPTLPKALAAMHRLTSRTTSFEAVQVYVLGHALLARDGGGEVLDYLREANDIDPSALLISAHATAHALLSHRDPVFQSEGVRLVREFKSTHAISDGGIAQQVWDAERRRLDGLPYFVAEYEASDQAPVRALGAVVVPPAGPLLSLGPEEQHALNWLLGRNDYAQVDLPDGQVVRILGVRTRLGWDRARAMATVDLSLTAAGYKLKSFLQSRAQVAALETETAHTAAARVGAVVRTLSTRGLDVMDLREVAREAGAPFPGVRATPVAFEVHVNVLPVPERQPAP